MWRAYLYLRYLVFGIVFSIWTAIFFLPALLGLFRITISRKLLRGISMTWVRGAARLIEVILGLKTKVEGEIPTTTPFIIAANHQSMWETMAIPASFPSINIILKESLAKIPVFGWYIRNYPLILIDRASKGKSMPQIIGKLSMDEAKDRPLLIFPEGTRVMPGEHRDWRSGLQNISAETQWPILPVAHNAGQFWGKHRGYVYPGTVTLRFLPLLHPTDPNYSSAEAERRVREAMAELNRS
ncbi:MAG: lysophospholipid acyltransferase family protein [Pseudomonadota bacterium]